MASPDISRMRESLRSLEARRSGLERNIADYRKDISSLERDRRSSGAHSDAYERQQAIDRKISERNRDIDNTKNELGRIAHEIRNLESALR